MTDNRPVAPRSIFVQDFVAVDRPFERVIAVARGALRESLLAAMLCDAWESQSDAFGQDRRDTFDLRSLNVDVRPPRARSSSLIVPLCWSRDVGPPLLDADLEFVRFGVERTHLSLTGRAPLEMIGPRAPAGPDRLLLAVVRHFLVAVSVALAAAADWSVSQRSDDGATSPDRSHGLARSWPAGA